MDFPSTREPKVGKPDPRTVNSSPALVRGFIVGRMEWSELVEPRHHVRRGVKSASEDALRKCESMYSPEAIAVRPYWHPLATRLAAPPMMPKEQVERAAVSLLLGDEQMPAGQERDRKSVV